MLKFADLPKTTKTGRALEMENGRVESVSISNGDHGCLTAWLFIEFRDFSCGFGGFKLGNADGGNLQEKGYAAEFIVQCLNTLGVYKWEDLRGVSLRCLHEGLGGGIVAIGHFLKDQWFCPSKEFE